MHIILGGTGHVGSALADALLARGEAVTIVSHDSAKAQAWEAKGATFALADIHDPDALRAVFRQGKRAFLLNPPANPSGDTDTEETRTITAILAALEGSGLEKVVAHSTYGAQAGAHIGDLGTLYELEQGLASQRIPYSIQRAAYYMTNWDMSLETARGQGFITSFFPADFALPMVAPRDLGAFAARLMTEPVAAKGLYHVEGPQAYTPADVAAAFSAALHRPVEVQVVPQSDWIDTFKSIGFSGSAAESFAGMTALTLAQAKFPPDPERGPTTLQEHVDALVSQG